MDWEQIWHAHWKEVYHYIYFKMNGARQDAEDLTQETFIRVMRSGQTYERAVIAGVLKTTALHLIIDRWRKDKNKSQSLPVNEHILESGDSYDPEYRAIHNELIRQALDTLNEDQRQIVVLRLIQGYSVKETSALTGRTEVSVRTLQFRAIRVIQEKLGIHAE